MARLFSRTVVVGNQIIPFGLIERNGTHYATFTGPTGKYERKSTGQGRQDLADGVARKLVGEAYAPSGHAEGQTWEVIDANLDETLRGKAEDTVRNYRQALNLLRALVETNGPDDITFAKCEKFKSAYFATTYRRAKGEGATEYRRTSATFDNTLRHLRSLWSRHLNRRNANPWMNLQMIGGAKRKPTPDEPNVKAFVKWIQEERYPGWKLPSLFVRTKAFLACRLWDICSARSEDLKDGSLTLHERKQGESHTVEIAKDDPALYAELQAIAGPVYLWENYTEELRAHLKARNQRSRVVGKVFRPESLYEAMMKLFARWNKEHPDAKLRSHDLRRRGITIGLKSGETAEAMAARAGMTTQTMFKHYADLKKVLEGHDYSKVNAALSL